MDTSYERHRARLLDVRKKEEPEIGLGLLREQLDVLEKEDALLTDEEFEQASPAQRDSLVP